LLVIVQNGRRYGNKNIDHLGLLSGVTKTYKWSSSGVPFLMAYFCGVYKTLLAYINFITIKVCSTVAFSMKLFTTSIHSLLY
jgi:hypothetical protein